MFLVILATAGCGGKRQTSTSTLTETASQTAPGISTESTELTATAPATPTSTPEPLAAVVNGENITMAEYSAELARYRKAKENHPGTNLATEGLTEESIVMQALIDTMLLSQGADQANFVLDEGTLESRAAALAAQTDLSAWMAETGYTEDSFLQALARSIKSAWMQDQILSAVPETTEQVHAHQILLYNSEDANQVYADLQAGADFDRLATAYDPQGSGDIGWFPRGYLTEQAVEEAAFNLQPGEISAIIETRLGFHILKVIEREPERLLEPDALFTLQNLALDQWLEEARAQGEIQVLVP